MMQLMYNAPVHDICIKNISVPILIYGKVDIKIKFRSYLSTKYCST